MMNKAYYAICDRCGTASPLTFVESAVEAVAQLDAQSWALLDEGPTYCEGCWVEMTTKPQELA